MKRSVFIYFVLILCFLVPNVSIAEQDLEKIQNNGLVTANGSSFDANSGWNPNVSPDIQMGYVPIMDKKIEVPLNSTDNTCSWTPKIKNNKFPKKLMTREKTSHTTE